MEINFYQCDESLVRSIAPLALKILEEKKKAIIFSPDLAEIKEIDNCLWSYGKNKFIPHITIFDKDFDFKRQPILISNKEENSNQADYLILTKEVSLNFIKEFSRVFFFYDAINLELAKSAAENFKQENGKIFSYKKAESKWIKFIL